MIKKYNLFKLIFILFSIFILFFISCGNINFKKRVIAENGILDLSSWDFDKDGDVLLDGEWEFYWSKLLEPSDFEKNTINSDYMDLPGVWNKYKLKNKKLPAKGFATYRLIIKTKKNNKLKALKLLEVGSAYKLWVNGKITAVNGIVEKSRKKMTPQYLPQVVLINEEADNYEIILQISNYYAINGGIWSKIVFGNEKSIYRKRENKKSFEFFLTGAILVMGIYHLGLFFLGKKEKSTLYFSLFCLAIVIRNISTGERIITTFFPNIPWTILTRLELGSVYIAAPLFCMFINFLFPNEVNKIYLFSIQIISLITVIITIFIPSYLVDYTFLVYQFILVSVVVYILICVVIASIKKRTGAVFIVIGLFIYGFTVINDVLFSRFVLTTGYLSSFGLFFFIFFEFALNRKFIRAEEKTKAILDAIPDSMMHLNRDGIILDYKIYNNDIFFNTINNLGNKNIKEVFNKKVIVILRKYIKKVLDAGKAVIVEKNFIFNNKNYYYEMRFVKIREKEALVIIREITEKKHSEEQLIQADKLKSLGTLVFGVAHEINNPNNSILLTSQSIEEDILRLYDKFDDYVGDDDVLIGDYSYKELKNELPGSINRIIRNARRIKRIVNDLKKIARKNIMAMNSDININLIIESSIRLIQDQISKATDNLKVELGKNIPIIKGDHQRLEQVIVNLIQNSCQALDDKEKSIFVSTLFDKKKKSIIIEVKDEGIGIDVSNLKNIFDPFFTTKRDIGGTGLGLSISSKIVKNHNGRLEVDSIPGKGTVFKIILPVKRSKR